MKLSDFAAPSFFENPYPLYERLRAEGPLVQLGPDLFATGHYDTIDKMLHDRRAGKSYLRSVSVRYGEALARLPIFQAINENLLSSNPPAHTRLRGLLMKAFNARQIDTIRDLVHATANRLIDVVIHEGTADLSSAFALPLPVEIMCRMLDVPVEDANRLAHAASNMIRVLDAAPLPPDDLAKVNEQYLMLNDYFKDAVKARRTRTGNDLMSALLNVEENGERLTEDEIVSNVIMLFLGGHETTSSMLCNALIALHRHPDQLRLLKDDPSLLSNAVFECLRYDSAAQLTVRVALEEIEIGGLTLPHNTVVLLFLGAANHDTSKFTDPHRLDIRRADARLQSFGAGIHHCLGYRLALLELEVGLETLLTRMPNLQFTDLQDLHWHRRSTLRGVESLTANW